MKMEFSELELRLIIRALLADKSIQGGLVDRVMKHLAAVRA